MGQVYKSGGGGGIGPATYGVWNDYSTVEHWTGKYLIDPTTGARKKVYGKRVYCKITAIDTYTAHGIINLGDKVSVKASLTDGTMLPKPHPATNYAIDYVIFMDQCIVIGAGTSIVNLRVTAQVDIEYTHKESGGL